MTTTMMTYDEALNFIHGTYGKGAKNGLANMHALLGRLGNPHQLFPSVHVAGTNGKGSVCAYIQSALRLAGYKTGLYTSPFLQRYNERMRIDGEPIPDGTLARYTTEVAEQVEALRREGIHPTEFEIGTAVAFLYFAREKVDIAVIEVGLGGRLDPTNVITPKVCAIASIGFDHMRVLGDTLPAIALEKAGIAKPGVPLVLSAQVEGEARETIARRCAEINAPLIISRPTDGLEIGLPGAHQTYNAGTAVGVLEMLNRDGFVITPRQIGEGLRKTRWPGRLEWIPSTPPLLMDGAHNPQGVRALAEYIATLPRAKTVLLTGIMQDKAWREMAGVFAGFIDAAVTVAPDNHRALAPEALRDMFREHGIPAESAASLEEGLRRATELAGPEGRVIAAGSLYLVGALRTLVVGESQGTPGSLPL